MARMGFGLPAAIGAQSPTQALVIDIMATPASS